jgi:hypothetical protein
MASLAINTHTNIPTTIKIVTGKYCILYLVICIAYPLVIVILIQENTAHHGCLPGTVVESHEPHTHTIPCWRLFYRASSVNQHIHGFSFWHVPNLTPENYLSVQTYPGEPMWKDKKEGGWGATTCWVSDGLGFVQEDLQIFILFEKLVYD